MEELQLVLGMRPEIYRRLAPLITVYSRQAGVNPQVASREVLLAVPGLGPETVDAILLYAAGRPVFVADAYARRVLARHRLLPPRADYETARAFVEAHLPSDPALFNELHALFVAVGKTYCRTLPLCAACPLRVQCTTSARGRSVQIHPDERLLAELRQRQLTPHGRAKLRERVAVEHTLAHIGHWQGRRARYRGQRKNLFDLRRCAVVHNLHVIARAPWAHQQAA